MNPATYYLCTYFDINYLTRGLALYESLCRHCHKPFVLWVLCFDDETYDVLARLNLPGMKLIAQAEFEAGDAGLVAAKPGRTRVEYYWTCTPSLPLYVLKHHSEVDIVTYVDADLYFYNDPQPIFAELGPGSILIIEHRYAPEHAHLAETSGIYNVGWLTFRRDTNGVECLEWWRDRCLEWCFARYDEGKFGDQLYLDDWPERFAGVLSLQHKGAGLAPWNLAQYDVQERHGQITVDGQPLIFFHFHGLRIVHDRIIEPAGHRYRLPVFVVTQVYLPYAAVLRRLAQQTQRFFVEKMPGHTARAIWNGLADQQLVLMNPRLISKWLWILGSWRRENRDHVAGGFMAHQSGDIRLMRYHFGQAVLRNPLVLTNLGIISLLVESMVGSTTMAHYRNWRHSR